MIFEGKCGDDVVILRARKACEGNSRNYKCYSRNLKVVNLPAKPNYTINPRETPDQLL